MKKLLFTILGLLAIVKFSLATPSNSISIPNSFSANTTISSSETNSNNNEVQTKFNAHSHTDITQTGTITSGTWQGGVIDETYGGTGSNFSATTVGNILYFSGTGTLATLAPGTSGLILRSNGAAAPSWVAGTTGITTLGTITTGVWQGTGIAEGYIANAAVDQASLKTTTGEVSVASGAATNLTLPGGDYGFYPQFKGGTFATVGGYFVTGDIGASYITNITLDSDSGTVFAQQRYVTASGKDYWLFLLIDKATKDIIAVYSAPDHPAYGNGGDFDKLPHPFRSYDTSKQEIVLVDNDTIAELKAQVTQEKSLLTLVNEEYKPNMDKEEVYKPLHSGKFIDKEPELVGNIPDYIKVRKLIKMSVQDKSQKKAREEQKANEIKQAKTAKENNIKQKLGLNDNELAELKAILK